MYLVEHLGLLIVNMKNTGLKNRFPDSVKQAWMFWYSCLVCGKNNWDALHHIISPTVRFYKHGSFNRSTLNSCPIHNHGCHLYNEARLHDDKYIKWLLKEAYLILVNRLDYELKPVDKKFLSVYNKLYE